MNSNRVRENVTAPLLICMSIRLGRNPVPSPLARLELGCTAPMGMAPKLVAT